ncbi:Nn.00g065450.m01.CDS01 [Neocucurbitaria sp. VM-36]
MPAQYANLSKPANVPSVSGGYLWADETNKCFYQFGGEYTAGNSPTDFSLWTYDVLLNQWNSTDYTSSERLLQRLSFGAGTQVESLGRGYYFGGWMNNRTTPTWTGPEIATSHLVEFDFTEGIIKNITGPDDIGRAEGQLIFLPASDKGVLIYFGGIEDPFHNGSSLAANMTLIHIYDIASGRWYSQTASGDVPLSRRQSCADVTWADDKSSFNIYMYGGYGYDDRPAFNDVYILSLPSFQWIKGYPLDGSDAVPDAAGHGACTANVVRRDQMLVIGGWFPDSTHTDCDAPNAQGQHNMILGNNTKREFLWDDFDPELTTYVVPPVVIQKIGGGPTGGATATAPASWDHPDLKNYYQLRPTFAARTATRSVPSTTASPSSTGPAPGGSRKTNVGAIAGGTVGGLVVLIAILCLILFCLHRRKRSVKEGRAQSQPGPPPPAELAVDALPHEMSTPSTNKYVHVNEQSDPNIHTTYSGGAPLQSRSASHEYTSGYPNQMPPSYGAVPVSTATTYGASDETRYNNDSPHQQNNAELFFPDNSVYPPQSPPAPQRQYSYPAPTSPLQQSNIPMQQQGQIYYPPPMDPTAPSQRSPNFFTGQRGSPTGMQHGGENPHGYSPNMSTRTTPAQFYSQPAPLASPGVRDEGRA